MAKQEAAAAVDLVPWWKAMTCIYQIYPRSFKDTNGDGVGDLKGITSQVDYLVDLGVDCVWFSPFYKSPQKDFGYDVSDYYDIDPIFGNMSDCEELIAKFHEKGIRIIFDMVMNHTSEEHPWFIESRESKDNAKRNYYIWQSGRLDDGSMPPNNWMSFVGKSGWNYDARTNEYYFANFLSFQPDLNYRNKAVKKLMFETVEFWMKKGVDGFRLDIFNSIYKNDDFEVNNPFSFTYLPTPHNQEDAFFQRKANNLNLPENFELAKELRSWVDRYSCFLIGEVSGTNENLKEFLGTDKDGSRGLHSVFQFDLLSFEFEAEFFRRNLIENEKNFPHPYQPTYVFGNHDQPRSISKLNGHFEKAKLLAVIQLTARGLPVIYYGEEIGMLEGSIENEQGLDPIAQQNSWVPLFLSHMLGIYINRDNCRTPMTWDNDNQFGGFSTRSSWLPISAEKEKRNVKTQRANPYSLWNSYKSLLNLRSQQHILKFGDKCDVLNSGDREVLIYLRRSSSPSSKDEPIFVIINFSDRFKTINLPRGCKGKVLFATRHDPTVKPAASIVRFFMTQLSYTFFLALFIGLIFAPKTIQGRGFTALFASGLVYGPLSTKWIAIGSLIALLSVERSFLAKLFLSSIITLGPVLGRISRLTTEKRWYKIGDKIVGSKVTLNPFSAVVTN